MRGLLIANKNSGARDKLANLFADDNYRVVTTDSVANSLEAIINKEIQVVVLEGLYDEHNVAKLVPLLKKCNRNISIILVTDDMPMNLVKKIRQEGIFYHALRPTVDDHFLEIREAVQCAFKKYEGKTSTNYSAKKERAMFPVKSLLSTLTLVLIMISPVFAVDTAVTYNSGLLVLLFVGFCALLIVAQLIPALLTLFGMTKAAGQEVGKRKTIKAAIKNR
jgi:FixJ family two-component response regulator